MRGRLRELEPEPSRWPEELEPQQNGGEALRAGAGAKWGEAHQGKYANFVLFLHLSGPWRKWLGMAPNGARRIFSN